MERWGWKCLTFVLLSLFLVLPRLAQATAGAPVDRSREEEEDDDWDDFDDDEISEVGIVSSKGMASALKALPQLNDQNAERILNSTEYVLLLGYASWCKQSAVVMVDFAEAAAVLADKGSPVVLAKVDAVANQVTAERFKLKGFPTIVFINHGRGEIYTAGQTRDDIVNWVQKRTGRPATTFSSIAEAEDLQSRNSTVVVGFFGNFEGADYEEFIAASKETVDVEFLQTTSKEAAKAFGVDSDGSGPTIAIWKSEPEKFIRYGGNLKRTDIATFVAWNKHQLVTKLNARNMGKVYGNPVKKQVLLFADSEDYENLYPLVLDVAKTFTGELMFLWVDIDDEQFAKPMTTMYGISGREPVVAGFDNNNGSRYLLELEVTSKNLKAFSSNFKDGGLKLHYKSEQIPKKSKDDVKTVVGKTFEKLVLKNSKDVLLLVHTPYCYECEKLNKVFVKLAKYFKALSSIIFAKMDASANEHPKLMVESYPAILLFQASGKNSPPVEAPSKPNLKKLVQFVHENHVKPLSGSKDCNGDCKSSPIGEVPPLTHELARPIDEGSSGELQNGKGAEVEQTFVTADVLQGHITKTKTEELGSVTHIEDAQLSQPPKSSLHDEL